MARNSTRNAEGRCCIKPRPDDMPPQPLMHRASHFRILYPIVSSSTWPNPAMACPVCICRCPLSKMLITSNERAREIYPPHSVSWKGWCKGRATPLQVVILVLAGQRHGRSLLHFLGVLSKERLVDLGSGGCKSGGSNEFLYWFVSKAMCVPDGDSRVSRTRPGLPTSLRASHRKGFSKL